jgi:hypothetical protein
MLLLQLSAYGKVRETRFYLAAYFCGLFAVSLIIQGDQMRLLFPDNIQETGITMVGGIDLKSCIFQC